jgi:hypothetical protein
MPLSTPISVEFVEVTEEDGKDGFSFQRSLLVLIEGCSYPIPQEQVCLDPWSSSEVLLCSMDSSLKVGKKTECPR